MRKSRFYIALLHHPMYNKRMDIVSTSVTNLDLHDISRAARTYDVDGFYVVHPSLSQQGLINDILAYWREGYGGTYNPDRKEAFSLLRLASNLDEVKDMLRGETQNQVLTVATDARVYPGQIPYRQMRRIINEEEKTILVLFGTGWGMQAELIQDCDYILEPVESERDYNHLSVRSAVSIILDRLLGENWFVN
ncbi:RNA methyltransferase [Syntrophomonas palmitatica]|uniref:RNA methyltransferase n=1 Tax=Syntrophomonas palmitatica TaxID=402877 RepID=UPI0009FA9E9C|nr:RNA methyltransferase [Syntrophomonas palmitatica]